MSKERNIYEGFDYSTFDLVRLKRLTMYQIPPTYYVSTSWGSACFLDPPGYPTHFLRSVYTQYGNPPHRGPTEVFDYKGELYVTERAETHAPEKHDRLMRRLWKPLPLDHERVRLWQIYAYCYFKGCYSANGVDRSVNTFVGAGPAEHHLAYLMIKQFYPEAEPHVEWSQLGGYGSNNLGIGDWIDMEATRPTPETCWPTNGRVPGNGNTWAHPVNGRFCQYCSWREEVKL